MKALAALREKAGLTQTELAELLCVEQPTVSIWETDKGNPTADKLPVIAKVLGCSIDDLFNDTGNRE